MKSLKALSQIALPTLVLACAAFVQTTQAQTILKVHHFLPATSNVHLNIITPWCDKIARESSDKLKCQIFPSMQLGGTPAQLYDQAKDGVADIIWTIPTYSAGRFTKSEVFELPFLTRSGKGSSQAFWSYLQKNAIDEYKGVKPLFVHTNDGSAFHIASKPVKTLEDLKGMKIRAATRLNSRMLTALGATPVQMPLPSVPESMSKGVIDGAMVPWEGVPTVKLHEIAKSHLDVPAGQFKFANSIFLFGMNQAKYDALPAELKKVIDANSGIAASALAGEKFDAVVAANHKLSGDRGNALNVLSDAEYKRWVKASSDVDEQWIKEASAKGANGKALLDDARALVAQYDK
jgi:TRAP-type C4-dicarboxylate transport system substrate-binding protein